MKKTVGAVILCALFQFLVSVNCQAAFQRGLFVSVIQNPPVLSNRQTIKDLVRFAKRSRIQTLFVQIYRENKAWFPSQVGDSTPYRACLKNVSEDPFALLIKEAHASGIEVHAWLNLMSLSVNENAPLLKKYGPEILTRNLKEKKTLQDYKIDDQYFLEPGDLRVREELSKIVTEVVSTYPDLDGLQFDYIRYPDRHPAYGFTKMNSERFKRASGQSVIKEESAEWKDWKREQVTGLLRLLSKKARSIRPKIQISTTGLVPYSRASLEAFQDWKYWLQNGLVDFITLMCYSADTQEVKKNIADAKNKIGNLSKVNIAVGAYKLLRSPDIFEEQFQICEHSDGRACVTFHYGDLVQNPALAKLLIGENKTK